MADRSTLNLVGAAVTGENVGGGSGVFKDKTFINNLRFKSLSGGTNIQLIEGSETITISAATGGGGGTPGGSNTYVQFNDAGSFGGSNTFTFNCTTSQASVGCLNVTTDVSIAGTSFLRRGTDSSSVELGQSANTTAVCGIAIGTGAQAKGTAVVAIGYNAGTSSTMGSNSIAIGARSGGATAPLGNQAISMGLLNRACGAYNISIGASANSRSNNSIAIGRNAYSIGGSVALGVSSKSTTTGAIGLGSLAEACSTNGIAIGANSRTCASDMIAIGKKAGCSGNVEGACFIAIGYRAGGGAAGTSNLCSNGIAIGCDAVAAGCSGAIAIGAGSEVVSVNGGRGVAIGNGATVGGYHGIAIGLSTQASSSSSIAIGRNACGLAVCAVAIGAGVCNTTANSTGLGWSGTPTLPTVLFSNTNNYFGNPAHELAIGHKTATAKIDLSGNTTTLKTFRMRDGNEAAGYVLTSDAGGYGTWSTAAGGGTPAFGAPVTKTIQYDGSYFYVSLGTDRNIIVNPTGVSTVGEINYITATSLSDGDSVAFQSAFGDTVTIKQASISGPIEFANTSGSDYVLSCNQTHYQLKSGIMWQDDIGTGGGTGATAANNGIVLNGNTVSLGGTLTGTTTIDSATFGFGIGNNATASGADSIALGSTAEATGACSIALGRISNAFGAESVAAMWGTAWGCQSFAMGQSSIACCARSFAFGNGATANATGNFGGGAFAFGTSTQAIGYNTVAFGNSAGACADGTFIFSSNCAFVCSPNSIAMGYGNCVFAGNPHSMTLGCNICVTGTSHSNHTIVENLAIWRTPSASTSTNSLVWDAADCKVKINTSGGGGGISAAGNGLSISGGTTAILGGSSLVQNTTIGSGGFGLAIGQSTTATGANSFVQGNGAFATGTSSIALAGGLACGTNDDIVIGQGAYSVVSGACNIVIGKDAGMQNIYSLPTTHSILLGIGSSIFGNYHSNSGYGSITLGYYARTRGAKSITIGTDAYVRADNPGGAENAGYDAGNLGIGYGVAACGLHTVALGHYANVSTVESVAIGYTANVATNAVCSIAIGANSCTINRGHSIAIGTDAWIVGSCNGISIGAGSKISATRDNVTIVSANSCAPAPNSTIVGGTGNTMHLDASGATLIGLMNYSAGTDMVDTAVINNLAILDTPVTSSCVSALVWDTADKKVKLNSSLGGGGTPGGADTQVQYNNGGAFGGSAELALNDTCCSVTIGTRTTAFGTGPRSLTVGFNGSTCNTSVNSLTVGCAPRAHNVNTVAIGYLTCACGANSFAQGNASAAIGENSQAFGLTTSATTINSHAEGRNTCACGTYGSHAEGFSTRAFGALSHAQGSDTEASGSYSHSEGFATTASGNFGSHAEGSNTEASGTSSHAQGNNTTAGGVGSHGGGQGTTGGKCVVANGCTSFNHSKNDGSQTAGHGALGDYSAILGGINHNIEVGNTGAVIVGGSTIKLTGTTYIDTTAVDNLAIWTTPAAGGSDDLLTWDSGTSKVRKVTQGSISDCRLKTNVQQLTCIDISSLCGISFEYNEINVNAGECGYGIMAQDVEKVFPLAVKNNLDLGDGEMYKTVDYRQLVPVLLNKIKELEQRVFILENKE